MIIDRIEEQQLYYGLNPEMEQAFAFISEALTLDCGRYELDNGLYSSITEGMTKSIESVPFEAHRRYIDLQYLISGGERISWNNINEMNLVGEDPEKDNYLYVGQSSSIKIRPGTFYIFFPKDAHRTGSHREFPKFYKKVVIKIPIIKTK